MRSKRQRSQPEGELASSFSTDYGEDLLLVTLYRNGNFQSDRCHTTRYLYNYRQRITHIFVMVTIKLEQYGLVRTLSGVVSLTEMNSSAQSIQSLRQLDEMRYNIHDFTAMTEAIVTDVDIEFMAARANVAVQRNRRLKLAFVGNHPVAFKMMNAFNAVNYSPNVVVHFDTLGEARAYVSS